MSSQAGYQVVSQREKNEWDDAQQEVIRGYEVRARSLKNSTFFTVFVPRENYSTENVRTLLDHQLALVDSVHNLSGS